jgi:hypothetical protein
MRRQIWIAAVERIGAAVAIVALMHGTGWALQSHGCASAANGRIAGALGGCSGGGFTVPLSKVADFIAAPYLKLEIGSLRLQQVAQAEGKGLLSQHVTETVPSDASQDEPRALTGLLAGAHRDANSSAEVESQVTPEQSVQPRGLLAGAARRNQTTPPEAETDSQQPVRGLLRALQN